jgi:hypothetical protein
MFTNYSDGIEHGTILQVGEGKSFAQLNTVMQLNITCKIILPDGEAKTMRPAELLKFHDDLTKFINDNWEALKEKDDD